MPLVGRQKKWESPADITSTVGGGLLYPPSSEIHGRDSVIPLASDKEESHDSEEIPALLMAPRLFRRPAAS